MSPLAVVQRVFPDPHAQPGRLGGSRPPSAAPRGAARHVRPRHTSGLPAQSGNRRCAPHLGAAVPALTNRLTDFEPFWEFLSGPLNATAFPASTLDCPFGPKRVSVKAPTAANAWPVGGYRVSFAVHRASTHWRGECRNGGAECRGVVPVKPDVAATGVRWGTGVPSDRGCRVFVRSANAASVRLPVVPGARSAQGAGQGVRVCPRRVQRRGAYP
ncbi:hypothetical protein STRTUCAR8_01210 [Streptomyces turgidiscabies Car8]|uniref:Uncharacterized protein n=1 Tax=Streptomyces turgidiscabies (strain Car8) TaxID=698760 RepID=L7FCL0_STRT8|nr:hypothetical protein STRTUCAR8_01210 [Streptomyces turgidiscabies Car8]